MMLLLRVLEERGREARLREREREILFVCVVRQIKEVNNMALQPGLPILPTYSAIYTVKVAASSKE